MIAADVNNDGVIDAADLDIVEDIIVNGLTQFPMNSCWRFIDKDYTFQNPTAPFAENFPEIIQTFASNQANNHDFIAVKVGNVEPSDSNCGVVCEDDDVALDFDGKDDFISLIDVGAQTSFSLGFWFETEGDAIGASEQRMFSFGPNNRLEIGINSNGELWIFDQNITFPKSYAFVNDKKCRHIAYVADNEKRSLYLDFELIDTYDGGLINYGPNTRIGTWTGALGSQVYFNGIIDHLKGYSTAIKQQDLFDFFTNNNITNDLEIFFDFDDGSPGQNNSALSSVQNQGNLDNGILENFSLFGINSNFVCAGKEFDSSSCAMDPCDSDIAPPTCIAKDGFFLWEEDGTVTVSIADIDNGSFDECGAVNLTLNQTNFSCSNIGDSIQVTLIAIDMSGNTSSCTSTIFFEDRIPPSCSTATTTLTFNGSVLNITPSDLNLVTSDNCGVDRIELSRSTFTCDDGDSAVIQCTVFDANGNSTVCSILLLFEGCIDDPCDLDTEPPVCLINDFVTASLNENGLAQISIDDVVVGFSDNCGPVGPSLSQSTFTCNDLNQDLTTSLTVTDESGNSAVCISAIILEDNISPSCSSATTTLTIGPNGVLNITPSDLILQTSDNCGVDRIELSRSTFTCDDGDSAVIQCTVFDGSNNATVCSILLLFDGCEDDPCASDTEPPVCFINDFVTASLNENGVAQISIDAVSIGFSDNCSPVDLSLTQSTFTCNDLNQDLTTSLTVTDESGNSAVCISTIILEDNISPNCSSATTTLTIGSSGVLNITPADLILQTSDNCEVDRIELSRSTFTCDDGDSAVIQCTVFDGSGNSIVCSILLLFEGCIDECDPDIEPPVCFINDFVTTYLNEEGITEVKISDVNFKSFDNCSQVDLSLSQSTFTCNDMNQDLSTVLTVTDQAGNSTNCISSILVQDTLRPSCSAETTTLNIGPSGVLTITPSDLNLVASDNCGVDRIELSRSTFTCDAGDSAVIQCTVFDASGNSIVCSILLLFEGCLDECDPDIEPPLCFINDFVTAYLNENGDAEVNIDDVSIGFSDNCSSVDLTLSQSTFTCNDLDQDISTSLTVTDESGNSAVCISSVILQDTIRPSCSTSTTTLTIGPSGTLNITPSDLNLETSDNCGVDRIELSRSTFTCSDGDSVVIQCTVFDASNNAIVCSILLLFEGCDDDVCNPDETPPICTVQDLTISLDDNGVFAFDNNFINVLAEDNCAIGSIELSRTQFNCNDLFQNIEILVTACDTANNCTDCNFNLVVIDQAPPGCNFSEIVVDAEGGNGAFVDFDTLGFDNCGVASVEFTPASGQFFECGTYLIDAVVEDISGLRTLCDFFLIVENCDGCCSSETGFANLVTEPFLVETLSTGNLECNVQMLPPPLSECQTITQITWGDGTITNGNFPGTVDFIHEYTDIGDYEICVTYAESSIEICYEEQICQIFEISSDCAILTSVSSPSEEKVTIYPNPCRDVLNVQNDNFERIDIYNIEGDKMLSFDEQATRLDVSSLTSGFYLIHFHSKTRSVLEKFIKVD